MTNENPFAVALTPEFKERLEAFKKDWHKIYQEIARERTPEVDGEGKLIIKPKGNTGYDYIEEAYMRAMLDKHFPGWSVEQAAPLQFLGSEWVVAQVILSIIDEHLLAFNINPPIRKFYGVDSVRIQYKSGTPHTEDNIIDVGDNCKQAVTSAIKYAINRLTRIGDDVYGKRTEEEGAGTIEEVQEIILQETGDAGAFTKLLKEYKILISEACKLLEVSDIREIKDYQEAWGKIKKIKGIK
jgi:hypothetical protein